MVTRAIDPKVIGRLKSELGLRPLSSDVGLTSDIPK